MPVCGACYVHPSCYWYKCPGGMGDECEKFLKNLAELLAKEDGDFFNKTILIFIVEQSIYRVYYVNILETC